MSWLRVDLALWVVLGAVWLVAAPFSVRTLRRESLGARLAYLVPAALGGFLLRAPVGRGTWLAARVVPHATWSGIVSVAVTAAGIGFALWARATLGRLWSGTVTLKEGHHLVDTGPYALARHPIYTGFLVAASGTVLALGTARALLAVPLLAASFLLKIRTEEKLLAAQFGDEHRRYRARVKRLVPFVW